MHKQCCRAGQMVAVEHCWAGRLSVPLCPLQVSIDCPWSIYSTVIALTFSVPFRTTHSLLSSGTR